MRLLAPTTLLLVLLLSYSSFIYGQGISVEIKSPPASSGSETFTSLDGRFTASLPQQPSSYRPQSVDTPGGRVEGHLYTWATSYGRFGIAFIDRPDQIEKLGKQFLDDFRTNLLAKIGGGKGKLTGETDLSLDAHPGRELKVEFPDSLFIFRIYLVGQRMYQLSAIISNDKRVQEAEVLKVFASFKLLTQADIDAELKKKIAEATPGPLPQEPVADRLKSDAEDEGLKGKVRIIFTETEDLSGTWTVSKRKPSSMEYYNERGNLTRRESYDYRGNLSDITVYGYLDGDRVSNSRSIEHEYSPTVIMATAPGEAKPKYDLRYSYKFKFKYDKGNLIEKVWYGNDGKLWLRYVYNFKGNQREELIYSADGSLNGKYLVTLDDKGNEIEEVIYEAKDNSVSDKYSYSYEYDSKGNWIKRTTLQWITKDSKSSSEPYSLTYRTITYY